MRVEQMENRNIKEYIPLPTLRRYHQSSAQIKAIIGPVGSGKTSAAALEHLYYLPHFIAKEHRLTSTRWVVIRNTYRELMDTTQRTVFEWFPDADFSPTMNTLNLRYADDIKVEVLFRSCDRPGDIKKFKSLEITGYWADESIEIKEEIKRMLKSRIGRYPARCPVRFGSETTNPPDVEHPTYSQFKWDVPPPGPAPVGAPLKNHIGFWQPPYENSGNLRPGYYADLSSDYADNPDWLATYVLGKPGIIMEGRLVYGNFRQEYHVAKDSLVWSKGPLYRGWDNSGNCPACIVAQIPTALQVQVLAEFHTERMGIVDFTNYVKAECNLRWPGAEWQEWADPAGENEYSKREGGFTSNAKLMRDECSIDPKPSEQNWTARREAVDRLMGRYDGLLIDPECTRLINGFLGGYFYPEIRATGEHNSIPRKNKFSHVHDALQYLLVRLTESGKQKQYKGVAYDRAETERVAIFGNR